MRSRRGFIRDSMLLAAAAYTGASLASEDTFSMPDEGERHERTWMAFGANRAIWGRKLLPAVQKDLASIANTIAQFEPVSMLVPVALMPSAKKLMDSSIELIEAPLDDLWMRDSGPTFVHDATGRLRALDTNFNGWGAKQAYRKDAKVAALVAKIAGTPALDIDLVFEGGCIEVNGEGCAIISESCVLNDNRNPGVSKAEFTRRLSHKLGLQKILWIPGVRGADITDGHTDFYARFVPGNKVLVGIDNDRASSDYAVTRQHLSILNAASNHKGEALQAIELLAPYDVRERYLNDDFAAGYIGYYLCNGAVIVQNFGDKAADAAAHEIIQNAYPKRQLVALAVDALAAGGGSIHCATQQQPAPLHVMNLIN